MFEGSGTLIDGLMSPQRGKKMIGNLMKGMADVELPLLEESLFDGSSPSMHTIKEDSFPPDLIFSPLKELCPNDLLGYNELVPPVQSTVSSLKNSGIEPYSFSREAIPLPKDLFSATKEPKPKTKRARKKRRRGNSTAKGKRNKSKKAPTAIIPRDQTPRMCTAPLCGTIHASVEKLRGHIRLCHPNMRMRCWFPGCMQTFMVPEDLEEHAMDKHMPKRESSFFSRTKIRFKELTEVPDDGEIRPTKERKQSAPRVPTAAEAYSCAFLSSSKNDKIRDPRQLISLPIQSPVATTKVMSPTVRTPVPSPSSRLNASLPFKWMTDVVENTTQTNLETGIEEFFCLDPNPRMPLWNERVTEMHTYWVSDRKRAGYTPEIEVTDAELAKEDRYTLQTNITAFIAAHLSNLSAVLHVDDYNWSGRDGLSFTMDTPKGTVLARVTGMEYSIKEWNQKLSDAESIIAKGFFHINNGKAIIDGFSCWGNRCTRFVQKAEEAMTGASKTRGNVKWVNVTFRGIPMAFFVTARDVHAGELAYLLSGSSSKP